MTGFMVRGLIAWLAGLLIFLSWSNGGMGTVAAFVCATGIFLVAHACGWRNITERESNADS